MPMMMAAPASRGPRRRTAPARGQAGTRGMKKEITQLKSLVGRMTMSPPCKPKKNKQTNYQKNKGKAKNKLKGISNWGGGNPKMFDAFSYNAKQTAVPTITSTGESVHNRVQCRAVFKDLGIPQESYDVNGTQEVRGGRNVIIIHPYNNIAMLRTTEKELGRLVKSVSGVNKEATANQFITFKRMDQEGDQPSEIMPQRMSVRIRNLSKLRDLEGGVYALRIPHITGLTEVFDKNDGTTDKIHYGEEVNSEAVDFSTLITHDNIRFTSARKLTDPHQINCLPVDQTDYMDFAPYLHAAAQGAPLTYDQIKQTSSNVNGLRHNFDHAGWMNSATGDLTQKGKFFAQHGGADQGVNYRNSGMDSIVLFFESGVDPQNYEIAVAMTSKNRYPMNHTLSQFAKKQPTIQAGVINKLRDMEESMGSTLMKVMDSTLAQGAGALEKQVVNSINKGFGKLGIEGMTAELAGLVL